MTRVITRDWTGVDADWTAAAAPGNNLQASATHGGQAQQRHVCTGLSVAFVADSTAPAAVNVTVGVRDGASGAGGYLWGPHDISVPAVAGAMNGFALSGLYLVGSVGAPLTIEFSGPGGNHTKQSVWMTGTLQ